VRAQKLAERRAIAAVGALAQPALFGELGAVRQPCWRLLARIWPIG
jgi:hypothetical protein